MGKALDVRKAVREGCCRITGVQMEAFILDRPGFKALLPPS
jgi:hypothetical protein